MQAHLAGLFERPCGLRFPKFGLTGRRRLSRVSLAVTFFEDARLQSPQVFPERVAHQCGTIPFCPASSPVGALEELLVENNLNGFHIVNLPQRTPHLIQH